MNIRKHIYTGRDVAFITPTKDRPEKLMNLLTSLSEQTEKCGQIIVVDGGKSIKQVVRSFSDRLPVEYYECRPPGQIRQRNVGIAKLEDTILLVGFIDDDMVLEADALEKMIDFWNRVEENTGGVGFNLVNIPPFHHSKLWGFFLMSSPENGRILPSGYNSAIHNISSEVRTQWLGGGYTVWRREVIEKFPQDNLNTRWAIGEDVRFSYPIGKEYPLYVCAASKARHEHIDSLYTQKNTDRYIGRKSSLAFFYLVRLHPELSRLACLWMLIGSAFIQLICACITLQPKWLRLVMGQGEAIVICLRSMFGYSDLLRELED